MSYEFRVEKRELSCEGRVVSAFLPAGKRTASAVVIYGHGQALGVDSYEATLTHLAGKGVVALHPMYDRGFFDQDWSRMGRDFVELADCALAQLAVPFEPEAVIFSGHSKGAYVAAVAAGLSFLDDASLKPAAVMLFQPAGLDANAWKNLAPSVRLTVTHSEQDRIVARSIAEELYALAPVEKKQLITLRDYRSAERVLLASDHFWPTTKRTLVGGRAPGAHHYYGSWRWLVAQAQDLLDGNRAENEHLFGELALDKGTQTQRDEAVRNW